MFNGNWRNKIIDLAALIVAYKRSINLETIIKTCIRSNIGKIYIAIDGPASESDSHHVSNCINIAKQFAASHQNRIFIKISDSNLGAAVSVLSACEWVFTHEEFVVIIEDDCLPNKNFFNWVIDAKKFLLSDSTIFLISGNQFAPSEITDGKPSLSRYPLIWGWATSKAKWNILISYICDFRNRKLEHEMSYSEYCFWRSGARRSFEGYVDAWDIPLAFIFQQLGAKSILPPNNLVNNIGGDDHATHTLEFSKWLEYPIQDYISFSGEPTVSREVDNWYRDYFFDIGARHIFSTKISWLLDRLKLRQKVRRNLLDRLRFEIN